MLWLRNDEFKEDPSFFTYKRNLFTLQKLFKKLKRT